MHMNITFYTRCIIYAVLYNIYCYMYIILLCCIWWIVNSSLCKILFSPPYLCKRIYLALKLLHTISTSSVTDPHPPYLSIPNSWLRVQMGSLQWASDVIQILLIGNLGILCLNLFGWLWLESSTLHCCKPNTHISSAFYCSWHQQAAAPSPAVAPGVCSWRLNHYGAGR